MVDSNSPCATSKFIARTANRRRLNTLPKEIPDLDDKNEKADADLEQIIQSIVMDETLIAEK